MPRPAFILAFALALALLPHASRAADPFDIYVTLPLTGQVAFLGTETAKGVRALEAYINKNGGIRGRPVHFVIADDQSNPAVEVQLLSQILAKNPPIVLAGELVANCNAAAGLLKENGPILYCFTPGVHPAAGSWIYSSSFSTLDMIATSVRFLRMSGLTKIATLTTTDASGQDGERNIDDVVARPENKGVTVVAHEHFAVTDISIAAQLARMKTSGAQVLIAWVSGTPLGTVLRGVRDGGIDMPLVTTPANLVSSQLEQYKSIMPSSPLWIPGIPSVVPEAIADRGVRRAIDQFYTAMKEENVLRPDVSEAIGWDSLRIVVEGFRKLGFDATPAQLRDYINGTRNWPGILGVLDYQASPQRGVQAQWCLMVRWDPNTSRYVPISKLGGDPLK
jgi:branched-chain amino acid transport system substrate-binding protein